jgi:hypothetical protein
MTRTQKLLLAWLDLYDTLTSPEAKDVYAGLAAMAGLALVAELVLGMFGK